MNLPKNIEELKRLHGAQGHKSHGSYDFCEALAAIDAVTRERDEARAIAKEYETKESDYIKKLVTQRNAAEARVAAIEVALAKVPHLRRKEGIVIQTPRKQVNHVPTECTSLGGRCAFDALLGSKEGD